MKNDKLYALINDEGLYSDNLLGTAVTGKDKNYLRDIKNLLDVFAVNGEDNRRGLWIEFPWDQKEDYANRWIFISVSCYNGHIYLSISDNDFISFVVHDDSSNPGRKRKSRKVLLGALKEYLEEKIPEIAADVDAYNKYVDDNLPYHQRTGRIPRKELVRIVPWKRLTLKDPQKTIQVLEACINKERAPFNGIITNDLYSKYYNIAKHTYNESYGCPFIDDFTMFGPPTDKNKLDDESPDEYLQDFQYGELGWSGMTLYLTDGDLPAESYFELNIGSDSNIAVGLEVAISLYDSGCPLIINDAERLLDIVEEKGEIILTSNKDLDCMAGQNNGSIFELPNEYEIGKPYEITREQYNEIVSLARWEPGEQVALINESDSGYS